MRRVIAHAGDRGRDVGGPASGRAVRSRQMGDDGQTVCVVGDFPLFDHSVHVIEPSAVRGRRSLWADSFVLRLHTFRIIGPRSVRGPTPDNERPGHPTTAGHPAWKVPRRPEGPAGSRDRNSASKRMMSWTNSPRSSPWSASPGRQYGSYWRSAAARIAASFGDRCKTPCSVPPSSMSASYAASPLPRRLQWVVVRRCANGIVRDPLTPRPGSRGRHRLGGR